MNYIKNTIGWADYSWNPVTGCYNDCEYCYAKKVWNRFFKNKYGTEYSEVIFHPDRLKDPYKMKKPSQIFVGSMTDLICYSEYMFTQVNKTIDNNRHHTFMFLSKFTESYSGKCFYDNCMKGLTVTSICDFSNLSKVRTISHYTRPFLSIEPLHGPVMYNIPKNIELVIIGAETGNRKNKVIPKKEWIQSIKDHVHEKKIYWKKNIRKYL